MAINVLKVILIIIVTNIGLNYSSPTTSPLTTPLTTSTFKYNVYTAKCPPIEITKPCRCNLYHGIDNKIECTGNQTINLGQIFERIEDYLDKNNGSKLFSWFELSNNAVNQLEDNQFRGLSFKAIYIMETTNLTKISEKAFEGNGKSIIERFYQSSAQIIDRKEYKTYFSALNSLTNVESITFLGPNFESIPDKAFNRQQNKLLKLDFNINRSPIETNSTLISSIGSQAFHNISNLQMIYLGFHNLSYIEEMAFDMSSTSNETLNIHLNNNRLNSTSFELRAFSNAKRPVYIDLSENPLTYLEEKVFKPFLLLNEKNKINLGSSTGQLDCNNCKLYWLIKEKERFTKQIENGFCAHHNNDLIWNQTFTHCS